VEQSTAPLLFSVPAIRFVVVRNLVATSREGKSLPQSSSARPTWVRIAPVLVLAGTFLAYAAVPIFGFVYDDEAQIVHDSFIQHWHFLPAYFTSHVWQWLYPLAPGNYYRPLFLVWLLLNFKLFALNPAAWHMATVVLHLVVTWQVYRLGVRLLASEWAALAGALLFGLHPVHVEAVAWISGATEPLAAIFVLASLLSYIGFRSGESAAKYWLTGLWFALGMLTKETVVLVPPLLFAYDMIMGTPAEGRLTKRMRGSLLRLAPFALIFAAYLMARYHALGALSHRLVDISAAENMLTIPSLIVFYARLLFWPFGLSAFYDTPYATSAKDALVPAMLCSTIVAVFFFFLWRRPSRVGLFAIVMLLLPLLPLMNLTVFVRGEIAHDRYLYLPSVGFVLLIGLLLRSLEDRRALRAAYGLCAALALTYFVATILQSLFWANNTVLYARGVQIAPRNPIARNDFANELLKRGDRPRAFQQYRAILDADPTFWLARYNVGYAEYSSGDCTAAVRDLGIAARQNPTDAETFFYLGHCEARLGNRQQAIPFMRHAIQLDSRRPNFRVVLADTLSDGGNPEELREALKLYREEATANPAHPYAASRATALEQQLRR
jgi:hypothetical protein